MRKSFTSLWKGYTKEKWKIEIPVNFPFLPPTLADIDSENLAGEVM
jgi:hypothetical protein